MRIREKDECSGGGNSDVLDAFVVGLAGFFDVRAWRTLVTDRMVRKVIDRCLKTVEAKKVEQTKTAGVRGLLKRFVAFLGVTRNLYRQSA
jgi:hypothetical protein